MHRVQWYMRIAVILFMGLLSIAVLTTRGTDPEGASWLGRVSSTLVLMLLGIWPGVAMARSSAEEPGSDLKVQPQSSGSECCSCGCAETCPVLTREAEHREEIGSIWRAQLQDRRNEIRELKKRIADLEREAREEQRVAL